MTQEPDLSDYLDILEAPVGRYAVVVDGTRPMLTFDLERWAVVLIEDPEIGPLVRQKLLQRGAPTITPVAVRAGRPKDENELPGRAGRR